MKLRAAVLALISSAVFSAVAAWLYYDRAKVMNYRFACVAEGIPASECERIFP